MGRAAPARRLAAAALPLGLGLAVGLARARAQEPDPGAAARARFAAATTAFAAALEGAVGPGLDALEAWTPQDPPGLLDDLVDRVAALPLGPQATPRLVALVATDDPFLQEAGLRLARASARQGLAPGVARAVDAAAARALDGEVVDAWVVLAAVELVDAAGREGPLEATLAALARAATRGPAPLGGPDPRLGPSGSRMRPVTAEAYARLDRTLGAWLGRAGAAEPAVLARLEALHGTRGREATAAACACAEAERRALVALAEGDRAAAGWALEQARRADATAGGRRAAALAALAALVTPDDRPPRAR